MEISMEETDSRLTPHRIIPDESKPQAWELKCYRVRALYHIM